MLFDDGRNRVKSIVKPQQRDAGFPDFYTVSYEIFSRVYSLLVMNFSIRYFENLLNAFI